MYVQTATTCDQLTQGCPTMYTSEISSVANEGFAERKLLSEQFLGEKNPRDPFSTG